MTPERRATLETAYKMVQDFARRYVAAGGKIHSGSDPGTLLPAYGVHAEFELAIDAGLSPLVAIQSASLNVAQAWGKDKDYGSVEKGKVADLVIVRGDVTRRHFTRPRISKKCSPTAKRWTLRTIRITATRFRGRCRTDLSQVYRKFPPAS